MAGASLVVGIVSIFMSLIGFGGFMGLIGVTAGMVGIVLGSTARKEPVDRGIATGGMVCSIVGTAIGLFGFVACISCVGCIACFAPRA